MSVQSAPFIGCAIVLAVLALGLAARRMGRGTTSARRAGTVVSLLLASLLVMTSMGLVVNVGGSWVRTTDDVAGLVTGAFRSSKGAVVAAQSGAGDGSGQSAQSGSTAQSGDSRQSGGAAATKPRAEDSDLLPAALAPDPSLKADFQRDPATGELTAMVYGPESGLTRSVTIWTPPDFDPNSGTVYDVLVFSHGYPGSDKGNVNALRIAELYERLRAAGHVRPFIFVTPNVAMDGAPPTCVDIEGSAKVETFATRDLVRVLRSTFPHLATHREGWMLAGISAGGYCAPVLALRHNDTFLGAMSMGGVDAPEFGPLANSGPELAQRFTISTMLENLQGPPVHMFFAGTKEEQGSLRLVTNVVGKGRPGDEIATHLDETGGHSWTVWAEQIAAGIPWWQANADSIASARDAAAKGEREAAAAQAKIAAEKAAAAAKAKAEAEAAEREYRHPAFFSIRGWGQLAAWWIAGIALLAFSALAGPSLAGRASRAGQHLDTEGARSRLGGFAARFGVATATALVVAVGLLLAINRVESFYTSWSGLFADLSVLL